MMTAAAMLKGRTIDPGISLGIAPGSRQILRTLANKEAMKDLIRAGARILESACGLCVGVNFSPKSGGVSVRTSNRNFEGRSGTQDAQAYLCSPEVAAAAAITGRLTSPDRLGIPCPKIQEPDAYRIDDSMFIFPDAGLKDTPVFRGPNIGEPPRSEKMTRDLSGRVMIKLGNNITTDHITPAGARLKYRSNVPKYSEFVFEKVDPLFSRRCLENKSKGVHNVIVAGESYGQGSSREHASMCPMYLGVKAVIARSFERIHSANLVNFGVLPLVFRNPADYDELEPDDGLSAENWREAVAKGKPVVLRNERSGKAIECTCALSAKQTAAILAGGLLNHITSA
jgi:aconitate hydratase